MEFQIRRPVRPPFWFVFVPGGACVLLGILIMIVPQLLVTLVATGLILIGAALLSIAWRFRTAGSRKMFDTVRDRFSGRD